MPGSISKEHAGRRSRRSKTFISSQDKKGTGEMTEVLVEKLVVAGQSVLTLIAELKRHALLSDFAALNSIVATRERDHEAVAAAAEQKLQQIVAEKQVKKA